MKYIGKAIATIAIVASITLIVKITSDSCFPVGIMFLCLFYVWAENSSIIEIENKYKEKEMEKE